MLYHFEVLGGVGFANALRRLIMSDIQSWAPYRLEIRKNTSCQSDEFLAHRVGLIPFRRLDHSSNMELTLRKKGVAAQSGDFAGPGFEPVFENITVMVLEKDQEVDFTVHFDRQKASKHARYCKCAAVGMTEMENGAHRISFELADERADAREVMAEALQALEGRVDKALLELSHQPTSPPSSMC